MADALPRRSPQTIADERVRQILQAADSWASDVPTPLTPSVRAVFLRLAEMIADSRHEHPPGAAPLDADSAEALNLVATRLRAPAITRGLEEELEALTALELRATGSWSTVPGAHSEWTATAVTYLERRAADLPAAERPPEYWADDIVAGVIASVRALVAG